MRFTCFTKAVIGLFLFLGPNVFAQKNAVYLKEHAVRINLDQPLGDSAYQLLAPFHVVMVGEMHGTREPARLVAALARLFSEKGDSVQVGLEIPPGKMKTFLADKTEENIYKSAFFADPAFESGRESDAWAKIIADCLQRPGVDVFFYDTDQDDGNRDSLMYLNLKKQIMGHPGRRTVTISGNIHSMTSPMERLGRNTTASFLKQDAELNLASGICSFNHYYLKGACRANFGKGLELRPLERAENEFDTATGFEQYLLLVSATSTYPYSGIFYTRNITPSELVRKK